MCVYVPWVEPVHQQLMLADTNNGEVILANFVLTLSCRDSAPSIAKCYLSMFQLQLCQLHQVLPEGGDASRLEVNEL